MDTSKAWWQSKILWAAFVNFIFSMVTVWTGKTIDPAILNQLPDMIANTIQYKEILMIANGVISIFIMLSRAAFTPGAKADKFWLSTVFWGAVISFLIHILNFTTGIEIPAEVQASIIQTVTEIITTGDLMSGLGSLVGVAIIIFKQFFTDKEVRTPLKPVFVSAGIMNKAA